MPQESCIYRRPGCYFSVVRADLFEFCEDNRVAAEILNFFIYRTDQILGVQQDRDESDPPIMECSKDQIRDHTISAGSIDKITDSLRLLESLNAITIHPPKFIGGSSRYELNIEHLNSELPKMTRKFGNEPKRVPGRKNATSFSPRMGNFPGEEFEAPEMPVWETSHAPCGKLPIQPVWETSQSPYGKLPTVYKEDQFSISKPETVLGNSDQKNHFFLDRDSRTQIEDGSTESVRQTRIFPPTLPQTPSLSPAEFPANDSVRVTGKPYGVKDRAEEPIDPDAFLGAYRRFARGAKKLQGADKKYTIERLGELDIHHDELMACLDGFIESDWAKSEKYPIRALLKDPMKWYKDPENGPSVAQDEPADAYRPSTAVTTAVTRHTGWNLLQAWNEKVALCPKADTTITRTKEYLEALLDQNLQSRMSDLVDKCDAMYGSDSTYVNLPWLLKRKDHHLRKNYERVLAGEYDFLVKKKSATSSLQNTIDQAREEFMAQFK